MREVIDVSLPDRFSYLDPPADWQPTYSAEDLKQMARRLRELLERDGGRADNDKEVDQ
jgi:hypothetical protein